jgi:predicted transcriptional regulator
MSAISVKDLHLWKGEYFTLRFGVKEDAVNKGGMNLFGEKFGNYEQNIIMKISYKDN